MHRTTTTTQKLPYRYNLPADLQVVKILASAQAMECARQAGAVAQSFTEDTIHVMAVNTCFQHEGMTADGKQGTNDPALFRATFLAAFREVYPVQLEGLAPPEADQERWLFYCAAAQKYWRAKDTAGMV